MVDAHIRCFTGEKLDELSVTGEQYIARRYAEYSMNSQDKASGTEQADSQDKEAVAGQTDSPCNATSQAKGENDR